MLNNAHTARAVALLAKIGRIEVNVLPKNEKRFVRIYKSITGANPDRRHYNVAARPQKKGGDQLRLVVQECTAKERQVIEKGLGITLGRGPGGRGWRKGNNDLCIDLIAAGLDIGRRPARIKTTHASVSTQIKGMVETQREYLEGFVREISREVRSRSRGVVEAAKRKHGYRCKVCGFDFGEFYGMRGRGLIEGHHKKPIRHYRGLRGKKVTTDDITPVCANCHRMLHRGKKVLSVERLREIISKEGTCVKWPWV